MNHYLKMFVIMLCVVSLSAAYADPVSRTNVRNTRLVSDTGHNSPTPYRPLLRQGGVLFVEDGSGYYPPTNPDPVWDSVLTEILGAGNYGWFGPTMDPFEDGPDYATMQNYDLVIWHNYDQWDNPTLTVNDQNNIGAYMDDGGKFWWIAQDGLYSGVPLGWVSIYFHMASANEDYAGGQDSVHLNGLAELSGISLTTICDYAVNPYWADELIPDGMAHGVIEDADSGKVVGIFYPGIGDWMSAFWSIDARDATFTTWWPEVVQMVYGMLDAFGVLGIHERQLQDPSHTVHLSVAPDPIARRATINYSIPIADNVKLQIYNKAGQMVITLIDEHKHAGSYIVTWNGRDTKGVDVPNGVYFIRLTCGDLACSRNIVVVK